MTATYRLSLQARQDVNLIYEHTLENWGAAKAASYHAGLTCRMEWLAEQPDMGWSRAELAPDLRSYPEGRHMLFYTTDDAGGILIVALKHQSAELSDDWGSMS